MLTFHILVKYRLLFCLVADEIYYCEKTFERLFLGALFGTNATFFIAGWRSDFKDQDENTRAMVYFLHHATKMSLKFPTGKNSNNEDEFIRLVLFVCLFESLIIPTVLL